jgi:aminobenzoyl-glutamate utilization protein B
MVTLRRLCLSVLVSFSVTAVAWPQAAGPTPQAPSPSQASSPKPQADKDQIASFLDTTQPQFAAVAKQIWDFAEVGYQEVKSSALLQKELAAAGFKVEAGVAGMPTGFVASYGTGGPVIGILAEFDALPGITQDASPERHELKEKSAGHACGHHLFGTGSTAAAIAVKDWLARTGTPGTIRLYGTPAEEGGAGKVYMVREGLFKDVDIVLHWHAGDRNDASPGSSLANKSAKFRFHGVSAHAAGAPERGRSALDGVEAMNHMVNMMREHVTEDTRIHYVITSGGSAPNVIPDFAEVFYYVRHPDPREVASMFDRVVKAAEGAAMGTGTTVDYEVIHGIYAMLPNETLAKVMDANLRKVGGVTYTPEERAFAEKIRATFGPDAPPLSMASEFQPFGMKEAGGSTDVADVSWVAPTTGLRTATWVPGTAAHSWQAIAAGGTSIGAKGMLVAAKTLALTAADLFTNPALIAQAKAEYQKAAGPNFVYKPLVGNRPPPLDYRKK